MLPRPFRSAVWLPSLKKELVERALKVEVEVLRDQQGRCSPHLFVKAA